MVRNYDGSDFNEIISKRCLVDFNAKWCGPCRMLSPVLDSVSNLIDVVSVDVDEYGELARQYGIMSIPCLIIFDKGIEVKRNIGYIDEEELKKIIK